jgi:uncharacterized cupredoxin-like copper-binding protein
MKMPVLVYVIAIGLTLSSGTCLAHGEHGHNDEIFGKPGIPTAVTRSIKVDMNDNMRFSPASIVVKQGETIHFIIKNAGNLTHEFVLGTASDLKQHNNMMKLHPNMQHSDPNMLSLAGGQSGELIWQFTKAGKFDFACLQPGHYEAGMKGNVIVAKGKSSQ